MTHILYYIKVQASHYDACVETCCPLSPMWVCMTIIQPFAVFFWYTICASHATI